MILKIISTIFEILKMRFVNITSRILLLIFGLIMHVENYFKEKNTTIKSAVNSLVFINICRNKEISIHWGKLYLSIPF